jgi:hypothetical protein
MCASAIVVAKNGIPSFLIKNLTTSGLCKTEVQRRTHDALFILVAVCTMQLARVNN